MDILDVDRSILGQAWVKDDFTHGPGDRISRIFLRTEEGWCVTCVRDVNSDQWPGPVSRRDQSTVCWPAQGHSESIYGCGYTWSEKCNYILQERWREIFTRWVIINNWGQIWRLTLALRYWDIPVIVAILKNVIVHEAHEFGCNSIIVSPLSLKYPSDI